MPTYRIFTEKIFYADSEDEAWDAYAWTYPTEWQWNIEIVKTD